MKAKLILGLGNPGPKYHKTRHNVGFLILDALAKDLGASFEIKKKLLSEVAKLPDLILAKPQTFMNESGAAAQKLVKDCELEANDVLVVHDEIDLPFGELRASSGGAAGHRGAESILTALGAGVTRLRIGVENRETYRIPPTDDYVLQNFTTEEFQKFETEIAPQAVQEIKKWLASHS